MMEIAEQWTAQVSGGQRWGHEGQEDWQADILRIGGEVDDHTRTL
jgi:hypothetical protein